MLEASFYLKNAKLHECKGELLFRIRLHTPNVRFDLLTAWTDHVNDKKNKNTFFLAEMRRSILSFMSSKYEAKARSWLA